MSEDAPKHALKLPALDPRDVTRRIGGGYPEPFNEAVGERRKRALTRALGLTRFGVNVTELPPGAASALRHWHTHEDEFVYVLQGHPTLVTERGTQTLAPGQVAGFPAGVADGHCFENRSDETVILLEVGSRDPSDEGHYPDHDLHVHPGRYGAPARFTRKNGDPLD